MRGKERGTGERERREGRKRGEGMERGRRGRKKAERNRGGGKCNGSLNSMTRFVTHQG